MKNNNNNDYGGSSNSLSGKNSNNNNSSNSISNGTVAINPLNVLAENTDARFLTNRSELISGWLFKVDKTCKRWAMRFFVLRGSTLSYYENDTERDLKGSVQIGPLTFIQQGIGPENILGYGQRPNIAFPTPYPLYLGPPPSDDIDYARETGANILNAVTKGTLGDRGSSRAYYFAARSKQQSNDWRDAILSVINASRRLCTLPEINIEKTKPRESIRPKSTNNNGDVSVDAMNGFGNTGASNSDIGTSLIY